MIWILMLLFLLYAILIFSLAFGFISLKEFASTKKNNITFSVIIPFRDEAKNLPNLLNSILHLNDTFNTEFIFVNDDSKDESVALIKDFSNETSLNIKVLQNKRISNSPKKDAISTAIDIAKNDWIITTDADCLLPNNWLQTISNFIAEKEPKMVVAPVNYKSKNTFLEQFQLLDFLSLQGTTMGSFGMRFPFLCNGANLAYKKDVFLNLNGFSGNENIASGDDIFLFEKFLQNDKKSVQFLKSKEATVTTFPVKSWKELVHQRTRWAAKTGNIKSIKTKLIGLLILLINISVLYVLFTQPIEFCYLPLLFKIVIDLLLFVPTVHFFKHTKTFYKWVFLCSVFYPFFSTFIVFRTVFSNYNWKGRVFKK